MTLEELLRQGKSFGQGASNSAASTVTGPVDMLAWLLRKGGVPVGDTPIGGEAWMRQKGLMATPENRLAGLLGEGAGLAAPIVAAAKAPEIAGGLLQMGRNLNAPAKINKQAGQVFIYPQEKALATAQKNAALPIEKGGLGLHPNNTPLERAQAMGFTDDAFHGTPDDRLARSRQFKDSMLGKSTQVNDATMGHFTANDGGAASEYIWRNGSTDGGNVLPLKLAGDRASVSLPGEWQPGRFDKVIDQSKRGGYDGLTIKGTTTLGKPGDYQVTFDPANIRSRFAAFDPARRNEADLLGRADPKLLSLIAAGGLLGMAGYNKAKAEK